MFNNDATGIKECKRIDISKAAEIGKLLHNIFTLWCNTPVFATFFTTHCILQYIVIKGGATLTPETGSVINGKCVTAGELPSDDVHLQLEVCLHHLS